MDPQPGPSRIKDSSPGRPKKKYKIENLDDVGFQSSSVSIDDLPDEILIEIFSYLSVQDRMKAQKVCCRWYPLMKSKVLWKYVRLFDIASSLFMEILESLPSSVLHFECHCKDVIVLPITLPKFMAELHEHCPSLKTLILESMYFLQLDGTEEFIPELSRTSERFQAEIRMQREFKRFKTGRSIVGDGFLRAELPELKTLLLRQVFFNPYHFYYFSISNLPKVTVLDLSYSEPVTVKLTEQELFTTLVDLEELYLIGWQLKDSNILTFIQNARKLKVLDLGFTSVTDSAILALQCNSLYLEELYLCRTNIRSICKIVEEKDFFPCLQSLCLRETYIKQSSVEELLTLCPSLKFLNVSCCKNITRSWYNGLLEDFQKKVNFIIDDDYCRFFKRTNCHFTSAEGSIFGYFSATYF